MGVEWSSAKMHKENENIYIGVIILLIAVLLIVGLRLMDAEHQLNSRTDCTEVTNEP